MPNRRRWLFGALVLGVVGCSAGDAAPRAAGPVISIVERDFYIDVPSSQHFPSGDLRLSVTNRGPESHELLVVRATGTELRLHDDGITLDEDALESRIVGVLEGGAPGTVRELRVRLDPGRYVMFCNMAGHYLGGMRTDVVVE